jgi:hypothetical protein
LVLKNPMFRNVAFLLYAFSSARLRLRSPW